MIIYEDIAKKKPVKEFHLGTVEVGKKQIKTFYAFNNSDAEIHDLAIKFEGGKPKGLSILVPKVIRPHGMGEIKVKWYPPKSLRKPLLAKIKITYTELFVAKRED